MSNRKDRARIAEETLAILERGAYEVDGSSISIADALEHSCQHSVLYSPSSTDDLLAALSSDAARQMSIEVLNCTSFAAARKALSEGAPDVLCLNFASAKSPGGGFLSGSQAQEESLARASGLYACLTRQMQYYEINRACDSGLYTHHAIYSPQVPVFRDDNDQLLAEPYQVSIVTSPAVNAAAVRQYEPHTIDDIAPTMRRRIESILAIARRHGHGSLILGAWGCGVFANDPVEVAKWFHEALTQDSRFVGAFERVIFAVLDRSESGATFRAFADRFA